MESTPPPSRAQILRSIKELLEKRPSPLPPQRCVRCGDLMHFLDAHFLLRGTHMDWDVPLPYCPVCDKAILQVLPCPETIH